MSADLYGEAQALCTEALCLFMLGNYKQSISLCNRGQDLLALCEMSCSDIDNNLMSCQAEVHRHKSEYIEAHNIRTQILHKVSVDKELYSHAWALLNIAEIDLSANAPKSDIQRNIDIAQTLLHGIADFRLLEWGKQADLHLRDGDMFSSNGLLFPD